jgi:ribokinase
VTVVVFGSLNVDFVTRVPAIPQPGETVKGESYAILPGGKGANQALAAARCGAATAMAGAVGRDPFAAIALANLHAEGIDCSAVVEAELPTGAAFISVDDRGENAIVVASGANRLARAGSLPSDALRAGDILLMQREIPDAEIAAAGARARAAGAVVVLNAAPADGLGLELLATVDHLIVNEHEARIVAGAAGIAFTDEAAFAADLARRRSMTVVVTLGAEGALIADRTGRIMRHPAEPVTIVDTTGAGDAFCGAYSAMLALAQAPAQALRAAVLVAGLACTALGAQSGLPDRETLKSRLTR